MVVALLSSYVDLFCRCSFTHQSAFHGANKNELLLFSSQESQKQVQELLNDSSGAEMSRLKIQLQQSIASKSVTEQLCETLQVWNDDHADCCLILSFLKWFSVQITCHMSPSFIYKAHVNLISLDIAKSRYFKNVLSNLNLFAQKSNQVLKIYYRLFLTTIDMY